MLEVQIMGEEGMVNMAVQEFTKVRMKKAEKTSGLLFRVLGNLYKAIQNIFSAANPATNTLTGRS